MTTTTTTGAITIAAVGKQYGPAAPFAMQDVSLDVRPGELVAVVGASGCGKSTLLRLVAGFEEASEGTIEVDGEAVRGPSPQRGVVFQDYGLFPWLDVRENVSYGLRQRRLPRAQVAARTAELVELVGLTRFIDSFPHQLSGGMQQRVALARVLANSPSVLLMDEPFGALDALTRRQLQDELVRIRRAVGTTIVLVTHSIEEAVYLADRVVVMTGGASHGVPGHVQAVVDIDLGAERDTTGERFNALEREISALVHGATAQVAA